MFKLLAASLKFYISIARSIWARCGRLIEAMLPRRGRYRNPQALFTGELTFW